MRTALKLLIFIVALFSGTIEVYLSPILHIGNKKFWHKNTKQERSRTIFQLIRGYIQQFAIPHNIGLLKQVILQMIERLAVLCNRDVYVVTLRYRRQPREAMW